MYVENTQTVYITGSFKVIIEKICPLNDFFILCFRNAANETNGHNYTKSLSKKNRKWNKAKIIL